MSADMPNANYKFDIEGLWAEDGASVSAIFITHAHLDHFGLLEFVSHEIPIYMSKTCYEIITKITPLLGKDNKLDLLHLDLNILEAKKPVAIGGFEITPHLIDHSVAGSLAFEINTGGKRLLYTGDFRFHGRQAYLSKDLGKIKNVDYLIMEGSTIGRAEQIKMSEDDLMLELSGLLKTEKLSLITFSAQNLDRFISVYKACLKAKKTLIIDPYTCYLLENFKHLSKNIPQFDWNNIAVYFASNSITKELASTGKLYEYKSKKIAIDEIVSNPAKYAVKDNYIITTRLLEAVEKENIQYIYSLWSGYLEKPMHIDALKPQLIHLHTSGHANLECLQEFASKINPKNIIPIHTENADRYEELFKIPVALSEDREVFSL
jgi:ribonuclease J